MYFAYLVLIIAIVYGIDEVASQIGMLMKTEIAADLFQSENSVTILNLLQILNVPFLLVGFLYRPLADKWGRKTFLAINTFGMSLSLFIIFVSNNVFLYFIGAALIQFFVPHDMHVVYIMESSPQKHRAKTYSIIKFFANMTVMLIPILRRTLMTSASEWRKVYMIPAVVGLIVSFLALLFARETDAFLDSRIKYLSMTDEERAEIEARKAAENAQGGLIPALKFAFKHKQLRWLYITTALTGIGFIGSIDYQTIMSYGFAGSMGGYTDEILNSVSINQVTEALMLFPIGSAVAQVIMGFISDAKGRKAAAITTAANCVISFVIFTVGASMDLSPAIVGFFCGAFVGSYYSTNDVLIMMVGESSPTNLRSSAMSAQFIVGAIGYVICYAVYTPITMKFGNVAIAPVAFGLLVPAFIAALVALIKQTSDTRNVDMDTVTGTEWD